MEAASDFARREESVKLWVDDHIWADLLLTDWLLPE